MDTRDIIKDVRKDLLSGKDSTSEETKKSISPQYTRANQVTFDEPDQEDEIDEDEVEKLLDGEEVEDLMESLGGSQDE